MLRGVDKQIGRAWQSIVDSVALISIGRCAHVLVESKAALEQPAVDVRTELGCQQRATAGWAPPEGKWSTSGARGAMSDYHFRAAPIADQLP